MASLSQALAKLRRTASKHRTAIVKSEETRAERDDALREARDAGATYLEMQEAAGLTVATVTKALRRQ